MTGAELLADLRARGLRLWSRGGALYVAPRAVLVEADRAAITGHKSALVALLEAEAADPTTPLRLWDRDVMTALEIFPGAQIIAHHVPAGWPPAGGWIPSSSRRSRGRDSETRRHPAGRTEEEESR